MNDLLWIALAVAVLIGGLIHSGIASQRKLKFKLKTYFGKTPAKMNYELDSIEAYYLHKRTEKDSINNIDEITWDDLDMDAVYKRINVCLTSTGEEYLYNCLHEVQHEQTKLSEREAFIAYLTEHPDELFQMQMCLAGLGKTSYNGAESLIYSADMKLLKYSFIYRILAVIPFLCAALIFINLSAGITCLLCSFAINTIVYLKTKRRMSAEFPAIQYFASMLSCCKNLCKIQGLQSETFFVRLNQAYSVFKSLTQKMPNVPSITFNETNIFDEYLNMLFLSDIRRYNSVTAKIARQTNDFHDLYKAIGEIDMAICVLSFRESLPLYSIPQFHDEIRVSFTEIYHPLLASPVTNDGEINKNSIVTGSNASGKSTFIKALAINLILAQTIHTCAAASFAARRSLVMTSMAVRDNLLEGESYFITEIKSLKRILNKIQKIPCACFIDEILRGTNTVERISASAAVLNYLNEKDCLCMIASHDIELTNILKGKYDNYHFCEQMKDDGMFFDYKLRQGISQTRNAIKLLSYMGFDGSIIEEAEELSKGFGM